MMTPPVRPPMTPAWIVFERADEAVTEDCDDPTALKVVLTAIHSHPHMQIVLVWCGRRRIDLYQPHCAVTARGLPSQLGLLAAVHGQFVALAVTASAGSAR